MCERAFWDPAAAAASRSLISLESQSDVGAFDVLAFTISSRWTTSMSLPCWRRQDSQP